jgi:hypothetical protein
MGGETLTDGNGPETVTADRMEAEELYPEGGLKAWLVVVLGAWSAMIPAMGLLNTLAVLQAWISENELRGISESQIGWIFSCYAFFLYICGAQVGKKPVPRSFSAQSF